MNAQTFYQDIKDDHHFDIIDRGSSINRIQFNFVRDLMYASDIVHFVNDCRNGSVDMITKLL